MKDKYPKKYVPKKLTTKDKKKAIKELKKSQKAYKKGKYYTRKKVKSYDQKESKHVTKAKKMYNVDNISANPELAKKTGCSVRGLASIVKKGQGAYFSSGSRPNQTGHSWGRARLASTITGGKAAAVDFHILEEYCSSSSKALRLGKQAKKKHGHGTRRVPKTGGGRIKNKKTIKNKKKVMDIHKGFKPNLSPREMFKLGSFGGTYWRPIHSKITGRDYKNIHKKYPPSWWKGIPEENLSNPKYDIKKNKYKVKVGTTLEFWEEKKWIKEKHPYGWVHWYCDYYNGKRGSDDERQIKRWLGIAGSRGRFMRFLVTLILKNGAKWDDKTVSPKIRQVLQHWGYKLTKKDFDNEVKRRKK